MQNIQKKELYFLRSSEQKIVNDMLKYAHNYTDDLAKYSDFYGLTQKDLGLYALVDNKIAGAIWSRKLLKEHFSAGFVDENTPVISMAVLPEFRDKGIGSFMMEQFLQEAGSVYEQVSIFVDNNEKTINFYKKFGFELIEDKKIMVKKLEKKEIIRPTDGYDPTRWMD
jgi:ribosomal protein S18 acetylase RimI-like enzyme